MRFRGWLLDAYIRDKYTVYWFKKRGGGAVQLKELNRPCFTVEPSHLNNPRDLVYLFEEHPFVYRAEIVQRYPTLSRDKLVPVVEVTVEQPDDLKDVLRYAERLPEVKEVYDTGLIPIQWHLIRRSLPPTSLCDVEFEKGFIKEVRVLEPVNRI
ncbi:hypothetical protein ACFL0D_09465, partial [Thermoproteota archaeon]